MSTFRVQVDVSDIEGLADDLARLSGEDINRVTALAINKTAEWVDEESHALMLGGINMEPAYAKAFRDVDPANPAKLKATVGTRANATQLSRFDAKPVAVAAKSPIKKLKGNPALGISRGQKQGGVTVEVTRGARKQIKRDNVFLNPGIRDSQGNPLVMERLSGSTRSGKDVLVRRLGPSPYQLFKHQLNNDEFVEKVNDYLERQLVELVGDAIEKAVS